jgi:general secretion pathway protein A
MNAKLLQLFGLKFHPFLPDIPIEGMYAVPQVDAFARRVEATVESISTVARLSCN